MLMNHALLRSASIPIVFACSVATACAQRAPKAAPRDPCATAIGAITGADTRSNRVRAYDNVHVCGNAGALALAGRWEVLRSVTDTLEIWRASSAAGRLRDARVFDALVNVAADRGANSTARILAIRGLLLMLSPAKVISLDDLTAADATCSGAEIRTNATQDTVQELPAGHMDRLRQISAGIRQEPAVPPQVLKAGSCLSIAVSPFPWETPR